MQDTLVTVGCIGAAVILGQMDAVPTGLRDIGAMSILGFVVWYTLTRINTTLDKLSTSIDNLQDVIEGAEEESASKRKNDKKQKENS